MLPTCVIYCRISRDRTGAGLGVERQERECRELAARLGWTVTRVYVDNDMSAYSLRKPRPDYTELVANIALGVDRRVLVWHTDRLHRHPRELEDYIVAGEAHKVATHGVVAGPIDLTTPSGRLVARQLGAVARYESELKSERILAKMREKADRREILGGGSRPFGFEADRLTVRPGEAEHVRDMVERTAAREAMRSIARRLNDAGVLTSSGGTWESSNVRNVVLRPRNAGLYVFRGQVLPDAPWPAIVPEGLWRAACAVLNEPGRHTGGRGRTNLLSGIARCGTCDRALTTVYASTKEPDFQRRNDQQRRWYWCTTCRVRRSVRLMDAFVRDALIGHLSTLDADPEVQAPDDNPALADALRRARLQRDGIINLVADSDFSVGEIREMKQAANHKVAELEARLDPISRPLALRGLASRDPVELERTWEGLNLDQRRALIESCVRIVWHPVSRTGRNENPLDQDVELHWAVE